MKALRGHASLFATTRRRGRHTQPAVPLAAGAFIR
jgi:hypothetical protein